jgi:hypothetical protein
VVELLPSKQVVAGSNPVSRSNQSHPVDLAYLGARQTMSGVPSY